MMMNTRTLAVFLAAVALSVPTAVFADDWITLAQQPQPLVAKSVQVVHDSETINIQKGQEKLQLFLTYYDGTATAPSYKWLRISSPSMNYVTEQQFAGQKSLTLNVSGELTWSDNQILIAGAGPVGATFGWILRTPKPTVTGTSTNSVYSGNTITINGTNFCSQANDDQVTIGGQPARIISATPTQIVVEVPEETKSGNLPIAVKVAGIDIPTGVTIAVTAQPYLRSLSAAFVAPGDSITIYGEGFSANVSNDEVYIGPFKCPIINATENSLTVQAVGALSDGWFSPNIAGMGAFFPVKVIVNGIKARNTLSVRSSDVG